MPSSSTGVDPSELYDGPEPSNVERFPYTVMPAPPKTVPMREKAEYVAALNAALDVISARLLGLVSVVAACAMWGWAVYSPDSLRTTAAVGFSVTVLLPVIALYWRRG